MLTKLLLVLVVVFEIVSAGSVMELNEKNFADTIKGTETVLILFYKSG